MSLIVNDVYSSIQGEGCLAGTPMVILRLHGCGVGCPWCDTKETWEIDPDYRKSTIFEASGQNAYYSEQNAVDIALYIFDHFPGIEWVLLTGGEPADRPLTELVSRLHGIGKKVAIETSGTALGHVAAGIDWVCVSPKINQPGGRVIIPAAVMEADEIKMVIGKQSDIEKLDMFLRLNMLKEGCTICLQPVSQSKRATDLCIQTVMERGWRLSLQTHKYISLK